MATISGIANSPEKIKYNPSRANILRHVRECAPSDLDLSQPFKNILPENCFRVPKPQIPLLPEEYR